jgi:hypothetical protein
VSDEKPAPGVEDTLVADAGTTRHVAGAPLPRGAALGRYVVLSRIGAGGMGEVYAAYDPELDRKVAIKLLHADGSGRGLKRSGGSARLLREAQALARLTTLSVVLDLTETEIEAGELPAARARLEALEKPLAAADLDVALKALAHFQLARTLLREDRDLALAKARETLRMLEDNPATKAEFVRGKVERWLASVE